MAAKPVVKWTTAGAERVPPAPWVKIDAGRGLCEEEEDEGEAGSERTHEMGLLGFAGLGIVNVEVEVEC